MSARLPFSVVTKPTGAACNLDCQYCFFLSKELLYDAAAQTMSEQTLERYVEAFLESSPDGEVTMLWQGGEPTLRGLYFFERLMDRSLRHHRIVHHVSFTHRSRAALGRLPGPRGQLVAVPAEGDGVTHIYVLEGERAGHALAR